MKIHFLSGSTTACDLLTSSISDSKLTTDARKVTCGRCRDKEKENREKISEIKDQRAEKYHDGLEGVE